MGAIAKWQGEIDNTQRHVGWFGQGWTEYSTFNVSVEL